MTLCSFWLASAFSSWTGRAVAVCAVMTFEPLLLSLEIGQHAAFVLVTLWFGLQLGSRAPWLLLALKPSALFAPACLALSSRPGWRWLAAAAGLVLFPFLALGPDAFSGWLDTLSQQARFDLRGGHPYNLSLTTVIREDGLIERAILAGLALLAAGTTLRLRHRFGIDAAAAFAIPAGLLVLPHSLAYDWALLLLCVHLARRSGLAEAASLALLASLYTTGLANAELLDNGLALKSLTLWALLFCAALPLVLQGRALAFQAPAHHRPSETTLRRQPAPP
jgi:hypothetical protein